MLEAAWAKQANAKPNLFAGLKAVYGGSIARAGLYQLIVVFTSAALPLFTFFLVVFVEQQSLPVGSSGASFEVDRQTARQDIGKRLVDVLPNDGTGAAAILVS